MHKFKTMENMMSELHKVVAESTENAIMEQLNEFISRDLIVVEISQPILVRDPMSTKVQVRQQCRLVLKDKEYIEKLERENKTLKEHLNKIKESVSLTFVEKGERTER